MVDNIKRPHVKIVEDITPEPQILNDSVNYWQPTKPPSTLYKVLTGGPKRYAFWEAVCKEGERLDKIKAERKGPNPILIIAVLLGLLSLIIGVIF